MRTKHVAHVAILALLLALPWLSACTESDAMNALTLAGGVPVSGDTCSGIYGNDGTTNTTPVKDPGAGDLILSKVTIDCSKTNPTIHARLYYVLNSASYMATLALYTDDTGEPDALVGYFGPFLDAGASDPYYDDYSGEITGSVTAGDYWVGAKLQNAGTHATISATSGGAIRTYAQDWDAGIPPGSLGAADDSDDDNMQAWFAF